MHQRMKMYPYQIPGRIKIRPYRITYQRINVYYQIDYIANPDPYDQLFVDLKFELPNTPNKTRSNSNDNPDITISLSKMNVHIKILKNILSQIQKIERKIDFIDNYHIFKKS